MSQPSLELLPAASPHPGHPAARDVAQHGEEQVSLMLFVRIPAALPHPGSPEPPQKRSEYSEVNSIPNHRLLPVMDALLGGDNQLVKQPCLEFIQG